MSTGESGQASLQRWHQKRVLTEETEYVTHVSLGSAFQEEWRASAKTKVQRAYCLGGDEAGQEGRATCYSIESAEVTPKSKRSFGEELVVGGGADTDGCFEKTTLAAVWRTHCEVDHRIEETRSRRREGMEVALSFTGARKTGTQTCLRNILELEPKRFANTKNVRLPARAFSSVPFRGFYSSLIHL